MRIALGVITLALALFALVCNAIVLAQPKAPTGVHTQTIERRGLVQDYAPATPLFDVPGGFIRDASGNNRALEPTRVWLYQTPHRCFYLAQVPLGLGSGLAVLEVKDKIEGSCE